MISSLTSVFRNNREVSSGFEEKPSTDLELEGKLIDEQNNGNGDNNINVSDKKGKH